MFQFLSDDWIDAARRIREEYVGRIPAPQPSLRLNVNVTDSPFGSEPLAAHIDTSAGELVIELGTLEPCDVSITIAYELTRRIFIDRDQAAATEAFFGGHVKVEGDLAKLLAFQSQSLDPLAVEIIQRIGAITAR